MPRIQAAIRIQTSQHGSVASRRNGRRDSLCTRTRRLRRTLQCSTSHAGSFASPSCTWTSSGASIPQPVCVLRRQSENSLIDMYILPYLDPFVHLPPDMIRHLTLETGLGLTPHVRVSSDNLPIVLTLSPVRTYASTDSQPDISSREAVTQGWC